MIALGQRIVLLFSTVAPAKRAASLHAIGCPMVNTARKRRGPIRLIENPTQEDIVDLVERGYPVARCPCTRQRA